MCFSTLMGELSDQRSFGVEFQIKLVHRYCQPKLAEATLDLAKSQQRWAVFHRRALWIVLQFAAIACKEDGNFKELELPEVGEICLRANDLLYAIESKQMGSLTAADDQGKAATAFVAHAEMSCPLNWVVRAFSCWHECLSDPRVTKKMKQCGIKSSLDELFLDAHGISLSRYLLVCISLFSTFNRGVLAQPSKSTLVRGKTWSGGSISHEEKEKVFGLISMDAIEVPSVLFGSPRQSWVFDISPFASRPLWELQPGHYVCPDILLFAVSLMDRTYFLLEQVVGSHWGNLFGEIFESHIHSVIKSFGVDSSGFRSTYFDKVCFEESEDEFCDGLLVCENLVAVCEFKGSRLTTRHKSGVSIPSTVDAIKKAVAYDSKKARKGVAQIAENLTEAFKGRKLVASGKQIDIRSKPLVIPVVVWFEEYAGNPIVREMLQAEFDAMLKERGTDGASVGPVLLFTTFDLEVFEQCARIEPAEVLLCEFAQFVLNNPGHICTLFRSFAHYRFSGQQMLLGRVGEKLTQIKDWLDEEHNKRVDFSPAEFG